MTKAILGKLFGDKGYISKTLSDLLWGNGVQLITPVRRNIKKKALRNEEGLLLRKHFFIETVNDELKICWQVEHKIHRSISGFLLKYNEHYYRLRILPKETFYQKAGTHQ
jgi:hypothetical protein